MIMRIVAAGDTFLEFPPTKQLITDIGEGAVLFSEGSLGGKHWNVHQLTELTRGKMMTIVGERDGRIWLLRNGEHRRIQISLSDLHDRDDFDAFDELVDIGYRLHEHCMALPRICADGDIPYEGEGQADVLLIASGGCDWRANIEQLLDVHTHALTDEALIVQCDHSRGPKFIYSVAENAFVGEEMQSSLGKSDTYIAYDYAPRKRRRKRTTRP